MTHRGVDVRKAVIAAAVTSGVLAVAARRAKRQPSPSATAPPVIPAQRTKTELEQLVEGDADLVVAEQEAQDAHILEALDQLLGRAS